MTRGVRITTLSPSTKKEENKRRKEHDGWGWPTRQWSGLRRSTETVVCRPCTDESEIFRTAPQDPERDIVAMDGEWHHDVKRHLHVICRRYRRYVMTVQQPPRRHYNISREKCLSIMWFLFLGSKLIEFCKKKTGIIDGFPFEKDAPKWLIFDFICVGINHNPLTFNLHKRSLALFLLGNCLYIK